MDQNWNNGGGNVMPAPNMGADTSSMPNNGMHQPSYAAAQPQMPTQPVTAPVPNMNMGGSAPVLNQPGITAPQAPVAVAQKEGRNTLVETIILVVVCLIAASAIVAAVIFFMKYNEVSEDMKTKINAEVAQAVAQEQEASAKKIEEAAKEPRQEFRGPTDYGSISFRYPKDWSVYVDKDGSSNSDFMAYFHKGKVPPLSSTTSRYSLRFIIYNRDYVDVVKPFNSKVSSGKLSSSTFEADSKKISGMKYEGEIDNKIEGVFIVFKVNDKTAILQTDCTNATNPEIVAEFEKIAASLRRNAD